MKNAWENTILIGIIGMVIVSGCANGACRSQEKPVPLAPEVRVFVPNGGEVWYTEVNYTIGWALVNVTPGQYQTHISYSISGLNGTFLHIANITSRMGMNSFRWTVPYTPTTQAVIRVEVKVGNATLSDTSDDVFEIRSLPQGDSVTVTVPNGGEVFFVNQQVRIEWFTNISAPLPYNSLIEYSTTGPNGPWVVIANITQQQKQGVYNWRVPNTPTKDAYIKVTEMSKGVFDISDSAFEIASAPNQPSVKVVTPNGGEVLHAGTGYNVTWNLSIPQGQDVPTLISYSITGVNGSFTPIAEVRSNRGMNWFTWVVNNTPTKEGALRVDVRMGGWTISDVSDNVFEIVGLPPNQTLERVIIIPKSATVEEGKSLQFQAKAFDKSGAEITPLVKFTWEVLGGIGTITPTGLFTAQSPGQGNVRVTGEYLGIMKEDRANVTVIPAGGIALSYIVIQPKSATVNVGKTLQFTAKGFDQYGNEIPPQMITYTWSVNNSIGTIDQTGLFTAKTPGDGEVSAAGTYNGVTKSDSAHVTVIPENETIRLEKVLISPRSVTVPLGNTQKFDARAVDQYGNEIPPRMVKFVWSVMGGIGTVDTFGLFTAQNVGQGSVIVEGTMNSITKSDTAGVTVVPQNTTITLTRVVIEPRGATLKLGEKIKFSGKAYDQFNNEIPQGILFTWGVIGNIGEIDMTGLFTAKNPGTGSVVLTGVQGTISKTDTVPVNVTAQGKIRVVIEPADIALTIGSTQQFTARVYDINGNEVTQGVTLTWSVNGTIGTINETGFFTAKYEGKGYIIVKAEYAGMTATNSTSVTVKPAGLSGSDMALIAGVAAAVVVGSLLALLWFRRRRTRKMGTDPDTGSPVRSNKKGENP